MESMAIADGLQSRFPEEILQRFSFQGQIGVGIRPGRVVEILAWLRDDQAMQMNHLRSLCGVDNARRKNGGLGRFEVVYNLYSIALRHEIRIRAQLTEADPSIDSVVRLWPGADWMERETYDLMGIRFNGHPNLCRVLLPEDWEGHPLRKEYPLRGRGEWIGITDLQAKIKELDAHGFKSDEEGPKAGDAGTGKREGEC